MTRTSITLLLVSALAATTAGCGGNDKQSSSPAAAQPAAGLPYGTYTRDVTKADLARTGDVRQAAAQEHGPNQELPLTGSYRLVIAKGETGGVVKVTDPGDFTIGMYASAKDGVLTLDDYVDPAKGAFCGPEVAIPASYRFELDGSSLQMEASPADQCADRDSMLAGTWAKG
jgi:hypothetical protein